MKTATSRQAADFLDTTTGNLRLLVHRGAIRPVEPGARPLRFHLVDLLALALTRADAAAERRTPAQRAAHDTLWADVDAETLASQVRAV